MRLSQKLLHSTYLVYIYKKDYRKEQSSLQDILTHYLQFEDLVYNYEDTRKKIAQICGLDLNRCDNYGKFFNPSKSINNTNPN